MKSNYTLVYRNNFFLFFLIFVILSLIGSVSATDYTINENNYNTYFDDSGNLISNVVSDGDTLDLDGGFSSKNFTISKVLTVTSKKNNADLTDCSVIISSGASGSSVSNLHIYHTEWYGMGIVLDGSSNNHIFNNRIECVEHGGVAVALLPGSTNNLIEHNVLNTTVTSWDAFHETVVLFASNYNTIRDNLIYCGDDNGIYASMYGRSGGVKSNYNNIINNTVICQVDDPSAWNYAIQIMGDYNNIINNTVLNSYRGISTTSGVGNTIIGNVVDNIVGDIGIYSTTGAIVRGNVLTNLNCDEGIYVGSNSIVDDNSVVADSNTCGLTIGGSNILIRDNYISSVSGATVYGIGKYSNITLFNNYLSSDSGVIVQLKRQSSKKFISDVNIVGNTIVSNSNVIVDARDASAPVIFSDNIYSGSPLVLLPESSNSSDNGSGFNGRVYNVSASNYDEFFDSNGIIRPNTLNDGDTVYFIGSFDSKILSINKRLKLTGDNPVFTNTTFRILESGSWIENLTIINNKEDAVNQWGLFISGANNVTVKGNTISVKDKQTAYAIYVLDSVDSTIVGNVLSSEGDFLTYTLLAYEVSNLDICDNIINVVGTGEFYNFSGSVCIDGVRIVPEIYRTYGILSIFISNSNISNNNVFGTSNLKVYNPSVSTNSIVGIDLYYESVNNLVSGNNVSINALDSYIYGLGVLGSEMGAHSYNASNNKFTDNNVYINGTYFATGIIVGSDSFNTLISNNSIVLNSRDFTYGLTFEGSDLNTALDNTVESRGSANYLVELYLSDGNIISDNVLSANGTNSFGIAGYSSSSNSISSNSIKAYSSDIGSPVIVRHSDVISPGTSGVYFMENSLDNSVFDNIIITNAFYAVNFTNSTGSVFDNSLKALSLSGDSAVYASGSNVYNNSGVSDRSVSLVVDSLVKVYGSGDKLVGRILDSDGNPISGHHISLTLIRPSSGANRTYFVTSDYMGVFSLDINLAPGTYSAVASYGGSDKFDSAVSDFASILVTSEESNKTGTVLVANKFSEPFGAGESFTGSLSTVSGSSLAGHRISVLLTRLSSGASKVYYVVCDYLGVFKLDINLARGEYSATCNYDGTDVYMSSSAFNTISIY